MTVPQWKQNVLDKYNITNEFFSQPSKWNLEKDVTMSKIITEATFQFGSSFTVEIGVGNNVFTELSLGYNELEIVFELHTANLTELYSFHKGMCYLLITDLILPKHQSIVLVAKNLMESQTLDSIALI